MYIIRNIRNIFSVILIENLKFYTYNGCEKLSVTKIRTQYLNCVDCLKYQLETEQTMGLHGNFAKDTFAKDRKTKWQNKGRELIDECVTSENINNKTKWVSR